MEGGHAEAHNAFCCTVERNRAGERMTECRDELQGWAGCVHLCSEGLSREHGNAEEEDTCP